MQYFCFISIGMEQCVAFFDYCDFKYLTYSHKFWVYQGNIMQLSTIITNASYTFTEKAFRYIKP